MQKSKKYTGVYLHNKQDGDTSYYITYRDANDAFRRVKVGDKSKGITEPYCKQKRDEIINKIRLGEEPPQLVRLKKKKIVRFDDLANAYFEDRAMHNRNNEREKNRYIKHIKDVFGDKDADLINQDDLKKFQKEKSGAYAPKTVNTLLGLVSVIFNTAIEKNLIKCENPAKLVKRHSVDNKRERYLSADEVKLLIESVKDNAMLHLFCLTALSTGARLETLLSIKKKDIDISHGSITLKDFKNNTTYKGFVSPSLLQTLKEQVKDLNQNSYLFAINDEKLSIMNLRERLQPRLNRLFNKGLKTNDAKNRVVVHTLRHTFASHLAINGTPIFTIQKLLNHKDIKMTMRYAKLAPDSGKEMVEGLYE